MTEQKAAPTAFEETKALIEERFWLWRLSCRLPFRDLERLNGILRKLSDDDLKRVAAYAEGLADFAVIEQESDDAGSEPGR